MGCHELYAGDLHSTWAVNSALFGWTQDEAIDMGEMGVYQLFATGAGGTTIDGLMTRPPKVPQPCWLHCVNVGAIDAAAARVTAAAGQLVSGPGEVPGGSGIAQYLDPQGAMVAPKR